MDSPPFGDHGSTNDLHGVERGSSVHPREGLVREEGGTDGVRQMPMQLLTKCAWGNHSKPILANDQ